MGSYLVVQISDIPLTADGQLAPGIRPRDNLLLGLRTLAENDIRPDVFLLTGDLTDTGDGACYDDLAEVLAEATDSSGASVIFLPGNHDDRRALSRHLLGGSGGGAVNQTYWRGGLRIIALDSTVPGQGHGYLDDQTLGYLRDEVATAAPDGTIVAMHHPPVPSPIEVLSEIALRNPEHLRHAVAGADVRIVLCGHYHHPALGTAGAVPVWVSPATAYQADPASTTTVRRIPQAAFSRIDLSENGVTVTVIPIPAGRRGC
ncbi:MAG: metallophosphoesterase family protein [Streptosporangiaceae bacterium]